RRSARIAVKQEQREQEEEINDQPKIKDQGKKKENKKNAVKVEEAENVDKKVAETKEEREMDDCCPICMEKEDSKRLVTLHPCNHILHRTCVLQWMETREHRSEQKCPLCRADVDSLVDKRKPLDWMYMWKDDIIACGPLGQPSVQTMFVHGRVLVNVFLIDSAIRSVQFSVKSMVLSPYSECNH
ncbi:hypothetical protein PFISCL1PPCAC_8388, partial [Pristionchus fissidentatus]